MSNFAFDAVKDVLRCPETRAELVFDGDQLISTVPQSRLAYRVQDGIPNMLVDDAREVPVDEWQEIMRRHGRDPETGAIV